VCARLPRKTAPLGSELRDTFSAREQLDAELLLKIAYRLTDGRLRDVNAPGRFAITAPLHDGCEVSKMSQFHGDRPFLSI